MGTTLLNMRTNFPGTFSVRKSLKSALFLLTVIRTVVLNPMLLAVLIALDPPSLPCLTAGNRGQQKRQQVEGVLCRYSPCVVIWSQYMEND